MQDPSKWIDYLAVLTVNQSVAPEGKRQDSKRKRTGTIDTSFGKFNVHPYFSFFLATKCQITFWYANWSGFGHCSVQSSRMKSPKISIETLVDFAWQMQTSSYNSHKTYSNMPLANANLHLIILTRPTVDWLLHIQTLIS